MILNRIGKPEDFIPLLFGLNPKKLYEITIKEHRKKRSKNANSYCWVWIEAIAKLTGESKLKLYDQFIRNYGVGEHFIVKDCVNLPDYFERYDVIAEYPAHLEIIVYKGSSCYDVNEMNTFINGVKMEAENLGIDTMTERELTLLLDEWKEIRNNG